jgi:hypothetical protein
MGFGWRRPYSGRCRVSGRAGAASGGPAQRTHARRTGVGERAGTDLDGHSTPRPAWLSAVRNEYRRGARVNALAPRGGSGLPGPRHCARRSSAPRRRTRPSRRRRGRWSRPRPSPDYRARSRSGERYRVVLEEFTTELAALYRAPRAARRSFAADLNVRGAAEAVRTLASTPEEYGAPPVARAPGARAGGGEMGRGLHAVAGGPHAPGRADRGRPVPRGSRIGSGGWTRRPDGCSTAPAVSTSIPPPGVRAITTQHVRAHGRGDVTRRSRGTQEVLHALEAVSTAPRAPTTSASEVMR